MYNDIMLDLETMGTRPGSAIVAIGAVRFGGGQIHDTFYRRIRLRSCTDFGLTIDADTVLWWMGQSQEARMEVINSEGATSLPQALHDFKGFVQPEDRVWGNGASFDNALLAEAYARAEAQMPWKFWNDRCYRTLKAMSPVPMTRTGTHHNALDDAISQAEHLMLILADMEAAR